MRRFLFALLSACIISLPALAQSGMTNITASHLESDISGALLTGKICLTPVLGTNPVAFTANSGAQVLPAQVCYPVARGVLNISVPDTALATPSGIGYKVVVELSNGYALYSYSQPIYPTGATWSLDAWTPTQTTNVTSTTVSYSAVAPSGNCGTAPAIWYTTSNTYSCINQVWALLPGAGGSGALPHAAQVLAGKGDGSALALPEKQVTVLAGVASMACDEDHNAGIYDPRCTRYAGGIYGATPAAAAQAMSNQMACDLAMGVVRHAKAKWPQGRFPIDQLIIAPGSTWEGVALADGGTEWYSTTSNHQLARTPGSMTVTCSDGLSHTDSNTGTTLSHFTLTGCSLGTCTNAPGDNAFYQGSGPGNVGLDDASGNIDHIYAQYFGGYGVRVDGQDQKAYHIRVYANDEWYYYGSYKGVTETAASAEANATTTGTTSSIALSWAAVPSAVGYVVYRGTSSGNEAVFFMTTANSFTDTGAAGAAGRVMGVVTNSLAIPGTITATPSTTGGTLAAGTYYYQVTAYGADGWHGSIECCGLDGMGDWIEAYGLADNPNIYNYHHIADFLGGGGLAHFDHLWPQLGQVGIAQPYGNGAGDVYEHARIDFTRLEGFWTTDSNIGLTDSQIDASCTASNAQTINTGQDQQVISGLGYEYAGTCNQFYSTGYATNLNNVSFTYNSGFGPSYATADILNADAMAQSRNVRGATFQLITNQGLLGGGSWFEPSTTALTNVTISSPYSTANVLGLEYVNLADTSPVSYVGFANIRGNAELYIKGGNANVTLVNDNSHIATCTGQNVNLGGIKGYLHFHAVYGSSLPLNTGNAGGVTQVCGVTATQATIASSEFVAYSATPTFSTATRQSTITLTGNITSFTLGVGADGQEKSLVFCQDATGGRTVAPPSNVHGFMTVGSTASLCSAQHFTYGAGAAAWRADSAGVINE